MSRAFLSVILIAFAATTSYADVKGSYHRVGGWRYEELPHTASCGTEARKTTEGFAQRLRHIVVGDKDVRLNGGGPIQITKRERDRVDAANPVKEGNFVKALGVSLFEDRGDTIIVFSRTVLDDKGVVCGDNWSASVDHGD